MTLRIVEAVEGEVVESGAGVHLDNLYRLVDVDRAAGEAYQRLTMPAAFEVLAAWESDEWRRDKQAEATAYAAEHGWLPPWSPGSSQSFYRWLQARAARDGHPVERWQALDNLRHAAECFRIVEGVSTRVNLPDTEFAWRPAVKLLRAGYRDQIVATVEKAAEIAADEGKPITSGIMLAARQHVWKTDPLIRARESAPAIDNRSSRDKSITLLHKAQAAVELLLTKGNRAEVTAFRAWFEARS